MKDFSKVSLEKLKEAGVCVRQCCKAELGNIISTQMGKQEDSDDWETLRYLLFQKSVKEALENIEVALMLSTYTKEQVEEIAKDFGKSVKEIKQDLAMSMLFEML